MTAFDTPSRDRHMPHNTINYDQSGFMCTSRRAGDRGWREFSYSAVVGRAMLHCAGAALIAAIVSFIVSSVQPDHPPRVQSRSAVSYSRRPHAGNDDDDHIGLPSDGVVAVTWLRCITVLRWCHGLQRARQYRAYTEEQVLLVKCQVTTKRVQHNQIVNRRC